MPSEVLISPSFPLQFHLQVRTELAALIPVLQWFESHGCPFLPESVLWQCKVALAEGFTNTVRYAHKNLPPTTPIDLELTFSSHSLEIKIWDHGQPFDLQAKLDSPQQDPVAPLEMESDRGLLLMRSLTDTLQYIRTGEGRNCLILQKSF
ncbi:anti-sigma regulatory factor [Microcystis aeruginosa NIES-298]|uniref:Sigma-B activity negative regulator n=1 Tax=Microcystis aeruginosa TAIHU98 TaxID=1134457 RepID=L7E7P7_MICAE|nr:sigma-B activity negative regulator [Microcystis aeruginosa TAIHU98]GBE95952.1 anti-sigma regulatory factor [Microcystis aeruginosa NIES-298]